MWFGVPVPPLGVPGLQMLLSVQSRSSPHQRNHPGELALIPRAARTAPLQHHSSQSPGSGSGFAPEMQFNKVSRRGGSLGCTQTPWDRRGESPALIPQFLPQTKQEHPRNPFTAHPSSSASTLGPKLGGKTNPASLQRARSARCTLL